MQDGLVAAGPAVDLEPWWSTNLVLVVLLLMMSSLPVLLWVDELSIEWDIAELRLKLPRRDPSVSAGSLVLTVTMKIA